MSDFEDAESFRRGDIANISYKEIVLLHLKRITGLACCEFRGGYKFERTHAVGGASYSETIYVPDTRETYINSINMLSDLLLPLFDKTMKEEAENLDKEYNTQLEKCSKKDNDVEWRKLKLENKRKLFQQLSLLLKRLRYLEGKSYGEEA